MREIESLYKKQDGKILIEIKLSSAGQLFNTFDPAPFYEKELDSAAEQYIVDTIRDFPKKTQFKIVIYLPPEIAGSDRGRALAPAIHNHFQYKMLVADRKLRERLRYSRITLLIGFSFLAVALFAGRFFLQFTESLPRQLLGDALIICGWVAMWEPVTVLLYGLWPIRENKKIFEKVSRMDIEILPYT